jgi:hypothetical protein
LQLEKPLYDERKASQRATRQKDVKQLRADLKDK